jgi:hypothetical protein
VKVSSTPPFHTPGLYNTFPGAQTSQTTKCCEIFRTQVHAPRQCTIMNKYTTAPNTIHYEFFSSMTHVTNQCRALDTPADRLD